MNVYDRLAQLGLTLPEAPKKGGVYAPCKEFGQGLIYVSGCGPAIGGIPVTGKLGCEVTLEQGKLFARDCMLNVLAVLQEGIGDLNRVKNVVKMLAFVASADDFYSQPQVANGGTELLVALFGETVGAPSRSAIGVNVLPGNIPVEIEALFEVE